MPIFANTSIDYSVSSPAGLALKKRRTLSNNRNRGHLITHRSSPTTVVEPLNSHNFVQSKVFMSPTTVVEPLNTPNFVQSKVFMSLPHINNTYFWVKNDAIFSSNEHL